MLNIGNKLGKTIVVMLFCFSIISCASTEKNRTKEAERIEQSTQHFFNQWYAESQQILEKNKAKGELQQSINQILAMFLSKDDEVDSKQQFPRLEYRILGENIKVSMYTKINKTPKEEDLIFSDVDFKHSLHYDNSDKKILIFTQKYQKILQQKLPYGFTDQTEKQNKNARALLIKMGGDFAYDIPAQIYISFNQDLNVANVYRYRKGSFGSPFWARYSKENKQWKFDGIKFNLKLP